MVFLIVAVVSGAPVLAAQYAARYPENYCLTEQMLIPDDAVLESGVEGQPNLWPIGTRCLYIDSDGRQIVISPDWGLTLMAIFAGATALAAVGLTITARLLRTTSLSR